MRWIRQGLMALAAMMVMAVLAPSPGRAVEYPWCAVFGGDMQGASNCGFVSFEQCLQYIRGIGGFCERNQFYTGPEKAPARKQRQRRSR